MAKTEQPDQEPSQAAKSPQTEAPKALGGHRSFAKARRELTEDELAAPAVQKLLLDEVDRLEFENEELSQYKDKFHAADKAVAVLGEKQKRNVSHEIISGSCLAVGSAALVFAPSLWSAQPAGYFCIAFGVVLLVGGIWAKVVRL
jgi:hypothetical protein